MFLRFAALLLLSSATLAGAAEDEWEPYRRTGLFSAEGGGGRWLAPEMKKETVDEFAARLLNGARDGDLKSMATLGRLFYVRGDVGRAGEWLLKAAEAGHTGAQFDYGTLKMKGEGADLVEAYEWLWLATWVQEPGADAMLQELSKKVQAWQVVLGVQRAAKYQDAHPATAKKSAADAAGSSAR